MEQARKRRIPLSASTRDRSFARLYTRTQTRARVPLTAGPGTRTRPNSTAHDRLPSSAEHRPRAASRGSALASSGNDENNQQISRCNRLLILSLSLSLSVGGWVWLITDVCPALCAHPPRRAPPSYLFTGISRFQYRTMYISYLCFYRSQMQAWVKYCSAGYYTRSRRNG
jgi:hypothetical protein